MTNFFDGRRGIGVHQKRKMFELRNHYALTAESGVEAGRVEQALVIGEDTGSAAGGLSALSPCRAPRYSVPLRDFEGFARNEPSGEPTASRRYAWHDRVVAINPLTGLAFALQSQPGVYAVLLGSGVSRAAQIPTGWVITSELIRRLAAAEGATIPADPADWYQSTFGKPIGFSDLLAALGAVP